jgi:hypothetical protein
LLVSWSAGCSPRSPARSPEPERLGTDRRRQIGRRHRVDGRIRRHEYARIDGACPGRLAVVVAVDGVRHRLGFALSGCRVLSPAPDSTGTTPGDHPTPWCEGRQVIFRNPGSIYYLSRSTRVFALPDRPGTRRFGRS